MKTFIMLRTNDETGVSGVGKVVEATQFSNGYVVAHWLSINESINIYKDYQSFVNVHIKSHPTNKTKVIWSDGTIEEF